MGASRGLTSDFRRGLHYFLPRDSAAVRWDCTKELTAESHDVLMQDANLLSSVSHYFLDSQKNVWALVDTSKSVTDKNDINSHYQNEYHHNTPPVYSSEPRGINPPHTPSRYPPLSPPESAPSYNSGSPPPYFSDTPSISSPSYSPLSSLGKAPPYQPSPPNPYSNYLPNLPASNYPPDTNNNPLSSNLPESTSYFAQPDPPISAYNEQDNQILTEIPTATIYSPLDNPPAVAGYRPGLKPPAAKPIAARGPAATLGSRLGKRPTAVAGGGRLSEARQMEMESCPVMNARSNCFSVSNDARMLQANAQNAELAEPRTTTLSEQTVHSSGFVSSRPADNILLPPPPSPPADLPTFPQPSLPPPLPGSPRNLDPGRRAFSLVSGPFPQLTPNPSITRPARDLSVEQISETEKPTNDDEQKQLSDEDQTRNVNKAENQDKKSWEILQHSEEKQIKEEKLPEEKFENGDDPVGGKEIKSEKRTVNIDEEEKDDDKSEKEQMKGVHDFAGHQIKSWEEKTGKTLLLPDTVDEQSNEDNSIRNRTEIRLINNYVDKNSWEQMSDAVQPQHEGNDRQKINNEALKEVMADEEQIVGDENEITKQERMTRNVFLESATTLPQEENSNEKQEKIHSNEDRINSDKQERMTEELRRTQHSIDESENEKDIHDPIYTKEIIEDELKTNTSMREIADGFSRKNLDDKNNTINDSLVPQHVRNNDKQTNNNMKKIQRRADQILGVQKEQMTVEHASRILLSLDETENGQMNDLINAQENNNGGLNTRPSRGAKDHKTQEINRSSNLEKEPTTQITYNDESNISETKEERHTDKIHTSENINDKLQTFPYSKKEVDDDILKGNLYQEIKPLEKHVQRDTMFKETEEQISVPKEHAKRDIFSEAMPNDNNKGNAESFVYKTEKKKELVNKKILKPSEKENESKENISNLDDDSKLFYSEKDGSKEINLTNKKIVSLDSSVNSKSLDDEYYKERETEQTLKKTESEKIKAIRKKKPILPKTDIFFDSRDHIGEVNTWKEVEPFIYGDCSKNIRKEEHLNTNMKPDEYFSQEKTDTSLENQGKYEKVSSGESKKIEDYSYNVNVADGSLHELEKSLGGIDMNSTGECNIHEEDAEDLDNILTNNKRSLDSTESQNSGDNYSSRKTNVATEDDFRIAEITNISPNNEQLYNKNIQRNIGPQHSNKYSNADKRNDKAIHINNNSDKTSKPILDEVFNKNTKIRANNNIKNKFDSLTVEKEQPLLDVLNKELDEIDKSHEIVNKELKKVIENKIENFNLAIDSMENNAPRKYREINSEEHLPLNPPPSSLEEKETITSQITITKGNPEQHRSQINTFSKHNSHLIEDKEQCGVDALDHTTAHSSVSLDRKEAMRKNYTIYSNNQSDQSTISIKPTIVKANTNKLSLTTDNIMIDESESNGKRTDKVEESNYKAMHTSLSHSTDQLLSTDPTDDDESPLNIPKVISLENVPMNAFQILLPPDISDTLSKSFDHSRSAELETETDRGKQIEEHHSFNSRTETDPTSPRRRIEIEPTQSEQTAVPAKRTPELKNLFRYVNEAPKIASTDLEWVVTGTVRPEQGCGSFPTCQATPLEEIKPLPKLKTMEPTLRDSMHEEMFNTPDADTSEKETHPQVRETFQYNTKKNSDNYFKTHKSDKSGSIHKETENITPQKFTGKESIPSDIVTATNPNTSLILEIEVLPHDPSNREKILQEIPIAIVGQPDKTIEVHAQQNIKTHEPHDHSNMKKIIINKEQLNNSLRNIEKELKVETPQQTISEINNKHTQKTGDEIVEEKLNETILNEKKLGLENMHSDIDLKATIPKNEKQITEFDRNVDKMTEMMSGSTKGLRNTDKRKPYNNVIRAKKVQDLTSSHKGDELKFKMAGRKQLLKKSLEKTKLQQPEPSGRSDEISESSKQQNTEHSYIQQPNLHEKLNKMINNLVRGEKEEIEDDKRGTIAEINVEFSNTGNLGVIKDNKETGSNIGETKASISDPNEQYSDLQKPINSNQDKYASTLVKGFKRVDQNMREIHRDNSEKNENLKNQQSISEEKNEDMKLKANVKGPQIKDKTKIKKKQTQFPKNKHKENNKLEELEGIQENQKELEENNNGYFFISIPLEKDDTENKEIIFQNQDVKTSQDEKLERENNKCYKPMYKYEKDQEVKNDDGEEQDRNTYEKEEGYYDENLNQETGEEYYVEYPNQPIVLNVFTNYINARSGSKHKLLASGITPFSVEDDENEHEEKYDDDEDEDEGTYDDLSDEPVELHFHFNVVPPPILVRTPPFVPLEIKQLEPIEYKIYDKSILMTTGQLHEIRDQRFLMPSNSEHGPSSPYISVKDIPSSNEHSSSKQKMSAGENSMPMTFYVPELSGEQLTRVRRGVADSPYSQPLPPLLQFHLPPPPALRPPLALPGQRKGLKSSINSTWQKHCVLIQKFSYFP